MKQVIFIAILVFSFCFATFAQANENINSVSKQTLTPIAQFNDADNEWYKLTVDIIGQELLNNPLATGLIRIKNDSNRNLARRLHLLKMGFAFRQVGLSRITFLIVDKQKYDTEVLILPNCSEMPKCEDCIVIRAVDIDRIGKLFDPKPITRKRKR